MHDDYETETALILTKHKKEGPPRRRGALFFVLYFVTISAVSVSFTVRLCSIPMAKRSSGFVVCRRLVQHYSDCRASSCTWNQ